MITTIKCFIDGAKETITVTEFSDYTEVSNGKTTKQYLTEEGVARPVQRAIKHFVRHVRFGDREPIIIEYDMKKATVEGFTDHPERCVLNLGCKTGVYEFDTATNIAHMEVDKLPEPCPDFIVIANQDFKFTESE